MRMVKILIWSIAIHGTKIWILNKKTQKIKKL